MLLIVKSTIRSCRNIFSPYIKLWRFRRFCIKHDKKRIRGFTILEVLVAIFVITVGVVATFNVVQNITVSFRINASRLTAAYLTQEGIEQVRNQRDANWLQGSDWDNIDVSAIGCDDLNILGKFRRRCIFSTSTNGIITWMNVSSTVSWQERGATSSITNATKLYKWQ